MTPTRHPADGRVHFSELKAHVRSPAHVRLACTEAREVTRAMLVGGLVDCMVFGQRGYSLYTGKTRNGKEWDLHKAAHPGEYLPIASELRDAEGAATAVLASPVAQALLAGCRFQIVAQWEAWGLPCAAGIAGERGGFDAVRERSAFADPITGERSASPGYMLDLKVTSSTEPRELQRHAWRMHWIAQGAWYLEGARAMGLDVTDFYLLAVEANPPHNVTAMKLSAASLEVGRRQLTMWAERHKQCEAAGAWPGYVQSAVDLEPEAWMEVGDDDE